MEPSFTPVAECRSDAQVRDVRMSARSLDPVWAEPHALGSCACAREVRLRVSLRACLRARRYRAAGHRRSAVGFVYRSAFSLGQAASCCCFIAKWEQVQLCESVAPRDTCIKLARTGHLLSFSKAFLWNTWSTWQRDTSGLNQPG